MATVGRLGVERLLEIIEDEDRISEYVRLRLKMLMAHLAVVKQQALKNDRCVLASARRAELGRKLMETPGVGLLLASALVRSVADPIVFKTGRELAARIGLVPKQSSSGGRDRLGDITRTGNRYLRQLLVVGAMGAIRYAERHGTNQPWLVQLLARRPAKVAAVARMHVWSGR